jgi:hypothetical protein
MRWHYNPPFPISCPLCCVSCSQVYWRMLFDSFLRWQPHGRPTQLSIVPDHNTQTRKNMTLSFDCMENMKSLIHSLSEWSEVWNEGLIFKGDYILGRTEETSSNYAYYILYTLILAFTLGLLLDSNHIAPFVYRLLLCMMMTLSKKVYNSDVMWMSHGFPKSLIFT